MKFFQLTPSQTAEQLNTDLSDGLTLSQIELKQSVCGKNEFAKSKKTSLFSQFLAQFKDYMIVILLIVSMISAIIAFLQRNYDELINAIAIVLIVLLNGIVGLLQSYKVEKTLGFFQKYNVHKSMVIRQAQVVAVCSEDLVPGDIVLLQAGDMVPADGRIIECSSLRIDENILSDATLPAEKTIAVLEGDNHPIQDITNMAFCGTTVVSGTAKMVVTSIGKETQIGKIFGLSKQDKQIKTPLQIQLLQMGRVLSLAILAICALLFVLGVVEGKPISQMLLTVVSLAVAAIPEGLTATVALLLAFGMQRLIKAGIVSKKLETVEALGSVDIICVDKTGVLTQDEMSVACCYVHGARLDFIPENYKQVAEIILYGSMCNDASLVKNGDQTHCVGDSTESAIISALSAFGMDKAYLDKQYPRMGTIPFDSERKCKSTIQIINGKNLVVVKGSPEMIFDKCINKSYVEDARKVENEMAQCGQRVLAIAVKEVGVIPSELFADEIECDLTLIGLIGLFNLPHSATTNAVSDCKNAGIRTIMISGDHVVTAKALAQQLGIFSEGDIALSGQQIAAMSNEEFETALEHCNVYSRISPEQRVCLVEALQRKGNNVLITGNKASDAASIEKADIGLTTTETGVDAAKNSADIIAADDSFAVIMQAIRTSRGIYNNIKKSVSFLLSGSLSAVLLIFLSVLFMLQLPVRPLHLLWINLFTNTLPALALGMEPARKALMSYPPRSKGESLITKSVSFDSIWQGVVIAIVAFVGFLFGIGFDLRTDDLQLISVGQSMAFAILAFSQVIHSYDRRSKHSLLKIGIFGNKYINVAALTSAMLILLVMIVPGVSGVFGIVKLNLIQWLLIILLSFIPFLVCEFVKIIKRI